MDWVAVAETGWAAAVVMGWAVAAAMGWAVVVGLGWEAAMGSDWAAEVERGLAEEVVMGSEAEAVLVVEGLSHTRCSSHHRRRPEMLDRNRRWNQKRKGDCRCKHCSRSSRRLTWMKSTALRLHG